MLTSLQSWKHDIIVTKCIYHNISTYILWPGEICFFQKMRYRVSAFSPAWYIPEWHSWFGKRSTNFERYQFASPPWMVFSFCSYNSLLLKLPMGFVTYNTQFYNLIYFSTDPLLSYGYPFIPMAYTLPVIPCINKTSLPQYLLYYFFYRKNIFLYFIHCRTIVKLSKLKALLFLN